jgi:ActR/RegA family two-component response regulator/GGDEF domain-containing protein
MTDGRARVVFGAEPLRVLCVSTDAATISALEGAVRNGYDVFIEASGESEALDVARVEVPHIAFVDVSERDGNALALVHHLPAVCKGIHVIALVPPAAIEQGMHALSLGASSLLLVPPTGDAVLGALADLRERRASARQRAELEAELARARRRSELMDRIVRLARGSGHADAVRAISDSIVEISGARGVALYATFGRDGDCVRLSAVGTAMALPSVASTAEVLARIEQCGAQTIPLLAAQGEIGLVVVDGVEPGKEGEVASMADLASAVLSLVDDRQAVTASIKDESGRVYTGAYFHDVAAREIDKAKRHKRRISIACVQIDRQISARERAEVEDYVLSSVRDTDTFARLEKHEYFLLMPETDALGAHACRRRVLSRTEGDRRSRLSSERRGSTSGRPGGGAPFWMGISTYPHDGTRLDLLIASARARAIGDAQSAVHGLGLSGLGLAEIVDTLLSRSMLGAGSRTPFPLDLAPPAVLALVAAACREGRRGGALSVHVTLQPGLGLATAARQSLAPLSATSAVHVLDVRNSPGCADLEVLVVQAEHAVWLCCGRVDRDRFRGVHASDPLLADLLLHRIVQAGSMRSG